MNHPSSSRRSGSSSSRSRHWPQCTSRWGTATTSTNDSCRFGFTSTCFTIEVAKLGACFGVHGGTVGLRISTVLLFFNDSVGIKACKRDICKFQLGVDWLQSGKMAWFLSGAGVITALTGEGFKPSWWTQMEAGLQSRLKGERQGERAWSPFDLESSKLREQEQD